MRLKIGMALFILAAFTCGIAYVVYLLLPLF